MLVLIYYVSEMHRRIIRKRAGIGRTRVTDFAEEGVFFKTSAYAHVRNFAKEKGTFLYPGMGVKISLQSTKYLRLWRRVTLEVTGLPSLLPPLGAAKQAEYYKI